MALKNKKTAEKLFFILIFLFFGKNLFSQEKLSDLNADWTKVLPGTAICPPATTSYGFCVATDAKTICGFSNSGIQIWEKSVQKSQNVKLTCVYDDFIILSDIQNEKITLFNPSGGIIWSKKLNYALKSDLLCGRDGRFFIRGENIAECYGLNGVLKWRIKTEKQNPLNIRELPDGSVIIFLQEIKGKTKGLRVSPFGKIMEEITFSGKIAKTYACNQGILLFFDDNSSGLFSLGGDNLSKSEWIIKNDSDSVPLDFAVSKDLNEILLLQKQNGSAIFSKINSQTGRITEKFSTKIINPDNLKYFFYQGEFFLVSDDKNSCVFSSDGKLLWSAKNPEQKKLNYELLTDDNRLIFFSSDWSLKAYRVFYAKNKIATQKKDYDSFLDFSGDALNFSSFGEQIASERRIAALSQGNYGEKEKQWLSEIIFISNAYLDYLGESNFGTRTPPPVFLKDFVGFEKILKQLSLFGNFQTQNIAAQVLEKETNSSFLIAVLNGIKQNGFDPDKKLLQSLEKLSKRVNPKDGFVINSICDGVFSICAFMGRSAFNSKGKTILTNFMSPQYSSINREYSRDILKKIFDLDL